MKIWIGLLAVLLMAGGVQAQDEGMQDVPLDDPAYEQIYELARILGEPIIIGSSRDMTRYQFAVYGASLLGRLQQENVARLEPGRRPVGPEPRRPDIPLLQASPRAQLLLSRLIKKFSPEISRLLGSFPEEEVSGFQPPHLEFAARELAAGRTERLFSNVVPSFPDVAPSHWAFEAVEYLRFSGVVEGYPGGHFNK